ncbi:MAG: response regulator [bacterium]|nr:response regulator [bacterium]
MDPNRIRIVYIEDEAFFAKTMSRLLTEAGYATALAGDGEEGLALVIKEKPDLVLLDLVLPKLDGKEVLRRLKNDPATKNIPVFVLSNLSAEADQRETVALGAAGFFVKAMTLPSVIVEAIKKRLD